jgi:hypothetical protein
LFGIIINKKSFNIFKNKKMIYINKNQTNQLIFTLNEKRKFVDSNMILELYSNADKTNTYIFLPYSADTSFNQNRWNQWDYIESNQLNEGQYDHRVYEWTGNTLTSVSGLTITESGKTVVIGSGSTIPTLPNNLTEYTFE